MNVQILCLEWPYSAFSLKHYLQLVKKRGGILLHSGKINIHHRFHLVGYDPLLNYTGDSLFFVKNKCFIPLKGEDWLNDFIKNNRVKFNGKYPFKGGLLGYISYEYKKNLEEKGIFKFTDSDIPLCELILYESVLVFDTRRKKCLHIQQKLQGVTEFLKKKQNKQKNVNFSSRFQNVNFIPVQQKKSWFIKNIKKIKRHIIDGDIYQANLMRAVSGTLIEEELKLTQKLFKLNPAPMQGYMCTEHLSLISTSPERFFRKKKKRLEAFPIKGTIKRAKRDEKKEYDKELKKKLYNNPKDRAELAMIADLLQNDLARVSQTGTVMVEHFPKIDSYKNVHHLYAIISSQTDKTNVEVFNALFPGGSITGCPKIKACQILEEIEDGIRGIHTGSLGYFSFDDQCDFNILIRSISIKNNCYRYQVGGGITLLSDPMSEWEETVAKEASLAEVLKNDLTKEK